MSYAAYEAHRFFHFAVIEGSLSPTLRWTLEFLGVAAALAGLATVLLLRRPRAGLLAALANLAFLLAIMPIQQAALRNIVRAGGAALDGGLQQIRPIDIAAVLVALPGILCLALRQQRRPSAQGSQEVPKQQPTAAPTT